MINVVLVSQRILTNYPDGALISYGTAHILQEHDLNEMLGPDDTVLIEVYASLENRMPLTDIQKVDNSFSYTLHAPDYIYHGDNGTIEKHDSKQPYPPTPRQMTEEAYQTCIQNMPGGLQQTFTYEDWEWLTDADLPGLPPIIEHWGHPNTPKP